VFLFHSDCLILRAMEFCRAAARAGSWMRSSAIWAVAGKGSSLMGVVRVGLYYRNVNLSRKLNVTVWVESEELTAETQSTQRKLGSFCRTPLKKVGQAPPLAGQARMPGL